MAVVIGLIVLKVIVSIISNSISIAAQAADSFLDILSIVITSIALQKAAAPADEEHPFGHSKAEGLAAMIQAILVIGAGGYIVFSAIQRIIHRTVIEPDEILNYDNNLDILSALQGRVPGLLGSSNIRGIGTPLFIVDGRIGPRC